MNKQDKCVYVEKKCLPHPHTHTGAGEMYRRKSNRDSSLFVPIRSRKKGKGKKKTTMLCRSKNRQNRIIVVQEVDIYI